MQILLVLEIYICMLIRSSKCLDMFHSSRVPGFRGDGIHIGCIPSSVACIQP